MEKQLLTDEEIEHANELTYANLLREAEKVGAVLTARSSTASREHSLSYTNLQASRLWSDEDRSLKESRQVQ